MNLNKITQVWIFLICGITGTPAQQTVPATGSFSSTDQGSVSVSVGQFSYSRFSGTLGEISEGVQQPYELFIITGTDENNLVNLKAYPNPTSEMLILRAENLNSKTLEYKLFDSQGKLLKAERLKSDICLISFTAYSAGIYFLNVISDEKHIKTFKIIRNE